jgi:dTMP kinase
VRKGEQAGTGKLSAEGKGCLIAFEGIEGAGKSTQIRLAALALEEAGYRSRVTLEPGGTELGRALRELLLATRASAPTAVAELFLYLADRAQHVTEVIVPALQDGEIVLSDRFSASTIAYQGHARGLDIEAVTQADSWARQGVKPLLNVLLDCPVDTGLARARGNDRFHSEVRTFHEHVREGFLRLAAADPIRWRVIDATEPEHEVHVRIMKALRECLPNP